MANHKQTQRGFTLIEMSIVLVIIGLIIGGILKGQELIESSRQKNVISQIDHIRAGVTTFVDRFKGYPGDFGRAGGTGGLVNAAVVSGNEDGHAGRATPDASVADLNTVANLIANEQTQFFNHLLAADVIGGATVIPSTITIACFSGLCTTQSPQPASAFPQSGLSINYGTHQGSTANPQSSYQSHWLILSRWAGAAALTATQASVSPERAFQIDNKYDDGLANEGLIRSTYVGTDCGGLAANYGATTTNINCSLMFAVE